MFHPTLARLSISVYGGRVNGLGSRLTGSTIRTVTGRYTCCSMITYARTMKRKSLTP